MRDNRQAYNHTLLGFRRDGDRLIEDDLELQTAKRIIALERDGFSMNQIARVFNEEGVKTKLGGRWHASTVKRVLDRDGLHRQNGCFRQV